VCGLPRKAGCKKRASPNKIHRDRNHRKKVGAFIIYYAGGMDMRKREIDAVKFFYIKD
jgi:hypothetical protein